jgi:hypothetical protein
MLRNKLRIDRGLIRLLVRNSEEWTIRKTKTKTERDNWRGYQEEIGYRLITQQRLYTDGKNASIKAIIFHLTLNISPSEALVK